MGPLTVSCVRLMRRVKRSPVTLVMRSGLGVVGLFACSTRRRSEGAFPYAAP
ncbi:hypothetical protein H4W31_002060 [Plantactinospora soyae]|uniref:Uncharacterized protein n=1 Tax=Plantactinospora soyae TaxID=1544732 RepID=A0A927QX87_9ACTN|nr:hypothetical protein [Plantactinospora soyae]